MPIQKQQKVIQKQEEKKEKERESKPLSKGLFERLKILFEALYGANEETLRNRHQIGVEILKERSVERDRETGKIKYGQVIDAVEQITEKLRCSRTTVYDCIRFGIVFPSYQTFGRALKEEIENATKDLSEYSDKLDMAAAMRQWHWVSHNMLYTKGEGSKTHVEFEADMVCQFKEKGFGDCDGDIVKMKVCGFHAGSILKSFNDANREKAADHSSCAPRPR